MNKQEQAQAFKSEIETTLKKWQIVAEACNIGFIGSIMIDSVNDDGQHFMQGIFGKKSMVLANLLATIENVPYSIKKDFLSAIMQSLMEIDEKVEHEFNK